MQQRIIEQLDDAIKAAASRIRQQSRSDRPASGDRRKRLQPRQGRRSGGKEGESDSAASTEAAGDKDTAADGPQSDRELRESRRGWGNLPEREREEVLQGVDEEFLERYREWIEQYYRALQEAEE